MDLKGCVMCVQHRLLVSLGKPQSQVTTGGPRAQALKASLKFRSLRRGARVNFGAELAKGDPQRVTMHE